MSDFFEMYGIHTLEELKVAERWKTHRTEQSLKAVIGQKAGCKDCILDVHEKYHGPHGLIAELPVPENRRRFRPIFCLLPSITARMMLDFYHRL